MSNYAINIFIVCFGCGTLSMSSFKLARIFIIIIKNRKHLDKQNISGETHPVEAKPRKEALTENKSKSTFCF